MQGILFYISASDPLALGVVVAEVLGKIANYMYNNSSWFNTVWHIKSKCKR